MRLTGRKTGKGLISFCDGACHRFPVKGWRYYIPCMHRGKPEGGDGVNKGVDG